MSNEKHGSRRQAHKRRKNIIAVAARANQSHNPFTSQALQDSSKWADYRAKKIRKSVRKKYFRGALGHDGYHDQALYEYLHGQDLGEKWDNDDHLEELPTSAREYHSQLLALALTQWEQEKDERLRKWQGAVAGDELASQAKLQKADSTREKESKEKGERGSESEGEAYAQGGGAKKRKRRHKASVTAKKRHQPELREDGEEGSHITNITSSHEPAVVSTSWQPTLSLNFKNPIPNPWTSILTMNQKLRD